MHSLQLLSQNLRLISKLYARLLSLEVPALDSQAHFSAMLALAEQATPITQNQLAEILKIDKSRGAFVVLALLKANLIEIEVNSADRREHLVRLSAGGIDMAKVILEKVKYIDDLSKTGISPNDLALFYNVSQKIERNLTANIGKKVI